MDLFKADSGSLLAASLATVAITSIAAGRLGLLSNPAFQNIPGAMTGVPAVVAIYINKKRRERTGNEVVEISQGYIERPPLYIVGVLGGAILVIDSALGALLGATVSQLVYFTHGRSTEMGVGLAIASLYLGAPLLAIATYFLSRRAAHYLYRQSRIMIVASVAFYLLLRLVSLLLFTSNLRAQLDIDLRVLLIGLFPTGILLTLAALLGARHARKTQGAFVAATLFRKLGSDDQVAGLELLREQIVSPRPST